ncbi:replication protein B [Pectobacterium brasiliense]|uniref:replication protein B n=1 Tax=Pectobacterium brasiliense TaxID=180957 RepID=UPI00196907C4|nr:replication protein B [Pectobacterium brasiliense]MBN3262983.1 replication protein B [Pectobacterium brasiliense]
MTAFTVNTVNNLPAGLRSVIGKHFADTRYSETRAYYDRLLPRYRVTVCFHAELKKHHTTLEFDAMSMAEREQIVQALDELRGAFPKNRKVGSRLMMLLTCLRVSERRTLYRHAGLSDKEFQLPISCIVQEDSELRKPIVAALDELCSLFTDMPEILTAVRAEDYLADLESL